MNTSRFSVYKIFKDRENIFRERIIFYPQPQYFQIDNNNNITEEVYFIKKENTQHLLNNPSFRRDRKGFNC